MKMIVPQAADSFVYACSSENKWGYEQFIPEHILAYQVSGETHIFHQQGTFVLRKNQMLLAHRNQFAKSLKIPASDKEYKAVSIIFTPEDLNRIAAINNITCDKQYAGKSNVVIKPDAFLKSYFQSLVPYLEQAHRSNKKMAFAKITEAITLLLNIRPDLRIFFLDLTNPIK